MFPVFHMKGQNSVLIVAGQCVELVNFSVYCLVLYEELFDLLLVIGMADKLAWTIWFVHSVDSCSI